jgi:hypothetical protein
VVRVLEAVNLLFAHQLFVVVVAVDSRWLLESLRSEFSDIFSEEDAAAPTPQNYLEKIIQIPFWLQPVRKAAFGRLVTNLVGEVDDDRITPPARTAPVEEGADLEQAVPEHRPVDLDASPFHDPPPDSLSTDRTDNGSTDEPRVQTPDVETPEIEPEVEIDLNPAALRLTASERDYLLGFYDLVTTPRATKRFLNTYQLLRSGIRDIDGYLAAEEYRPVLLLLALVTGTNLVTHRMVEELQRMAESTFAEFLTSRTADQAWERVLPACGDLPLELLTTEVLENWCTRVARYSFHPVSR